MFSNGSENKCLLSNASVQKLMAAATICSGGSISDDKSESARWRIHAYAQQLGSIAGERADPGALVLEQRFTLTRDMALRFDLSRQRESGRTFDTALLSLHLYF